MFELIRWAESKGLMAALCVVICLIITPMLAVLFSIIALTHMYGWVVIFAAWLIGVAYLIYAWFADTEH